MTIKLLVADGQEVVRAGLRELLRDSEITVAAEAASADEAVRMATQVAPDVMLLDVQLPQSDGFSVQRRINEFKPKLPVVMYSAHDNPRLAVKAHAAGACGFVLKSCSCETLLDVLCGAVEGRVSWNRRMPQLRASDQEEIYSIEPEVALTPREVEVLVKLCDGSTNKQIAQELEISYETVKEHVQHILHKVGVTDRTQAAVWAVRKGILFDEPPTENDNRTRRTQ